MARRALRPPLVPMPTAPPRRIARDSLRSVFVAAAAGRHSSRMDDPASDLLSRVRSGDESALHEFFRQHEQRLLRMIELRIEQVLRRRLDPSDVMQEAWIEIARRVPEWRRQDSLPLHVWMRLLTAQALMQLQRRHLATHKRDA